MAKKLTPEEALEIVKKELVRCNSECRIIRSILTVNHINIESWVFGEDRYALDFELINLMKSPSKALEAITDEARAKICKMGETDFTPLFWSGFHRTLQQVAEEADKLMPFIDKALNDDQYRPNESTRRILLDCVVPLIQQIREEINTLQAICKQFAK